jgi:hypothetical protein
VPVDNLFEEALPSVPARTEREARKLNEILFKSTEKELTADYLNWWGAAMESGLGLYKEAELDGTESSLRARMVASARMAQLCLTAFNFFGAAVEVIAEGPGDTEAAQAVARVTSVAVENKVEGWLKQARSQFN